MQVSYSVTLIQLEQIMCKFCGLHVTVVLQPYTKQALTLERGGL